MFNSQVKVLRKGDKFILALLASTLLSSASAQEPMSQALLVSFCDADTNCLRCSESIVLTIEQLSRDVVLIGHSTQGESIREPLDKCYFRDSQNWNCDAGRVLISRQRANFAISLSKPVSLNGTNQEICSSHLTLGTIAAPKLNSIVRWSK